MSQFSQAIFEYGVVFLSPNIVLLFVVTKRFFSKIKLFFERKKFADGQALKGVL